MEPAIGASTCAFGSQRCRPYSGILTIKASRHANHSMLLDHVGRASRLTRLISVKDMLDCLVFNSKIATSRGREPIRV